MRDRARAVVIGGGVGGAAVLYWLARLGWDDVVLVERADLTSGSTFHSAGLVGQLRGSFSLTKMMMSSVELYRTLEEEVGLETGWHEVGSLRLASSDERMEELARQAGWAQTFGLPLDLISAEEAQRSFPPMSTDGVLGAAYLPTDGYVDPSQLTFALAGGRETPRRGDQHVDARDRDRRRARPGDGRPDGQGIDRDRDRGQRGRHVRRGDRRARRRDRPDRPDGARVPDHAPERASARPADDARPIAPRLLPRRVGRPGHGRLRAQPGALGARRHPRGLQRQAARRGLGPLRGADAERDRARAGARRCRGHPADQRAGGLHPRRRVHPRPLRGARVLGRGGLLRPRARRRGRHGEARRGMDRRGLPSLDTWEMDSRRFGKHYANRDYTLARTVEIYSTYYDVKYPGHERQAGRPLHLSPTYPRLQELGAAFGEKSGWERPNWFEPNAAAGDESLAPARLGRSALVAGDRRQSTVRRARRPRSSTRRPSPRSRSPAPGPPTSSSTCATTASPATLARSPTRRC